MNNKRIWFSLTHMGGKELDFIQEAFDTNWVVPLGPNVDGFEKDLENYLGENKHIVALNAGTAAIHLGLVQLGVTLGDEVICQSFTFSASA
ncbi:MAG TPA: pyridoxal phosphate-dependent aminotransferase, partial [Bacteroidales bacterium]|nr:pyridoxal phosphate-dependent aminotransferase [Bacteroidales bacterium]